MDSTRIEAIIAGEGNDRVEFKAVLPPSGNIARSISALGNVGGGHIILGATRSSAGVTVHGLSSDFRVLEVVHQAIDRVIPKPTVEYGYVTIEGKQLFVIKVEASALLLLVDSIAYGKVEDGVVSVAREDESLGYQATSVIRQLGGRIGELSGSSTASKKRILDHYQSMLTIFEDLKRVLSPLGVSTPTNVPEGKILARVLFSSMVDNFEGYLADLLYEIFLAKPEALKSNAPVTVEEVLKCSDMQEFISFVARERTRKLQRGNVAEFIKDNRHITSLREMDKDVLKEVGQILEIRHLFTHRNGVVDEKFLRGYPVPLTPGAEFQVSVVDICTRMGYLVGVIDRVDRASVEVYMLDTV